MASAALKQVNNTFNLTSKLPIYYLVQATSPPTLQQAQTTALLNLLNLNNFLDNNPSTSTKPSTTLKSPAPAGPPVWKILVLDQQTKDVLATVLRVQDLRDVGVTLHV